MLRVLVGLIAVLGVGCGSAPAPPTDPISLVSPIREARTIPQPDGSIRIEAVSGRAIASQPYIYDVFTHCGFTANTFDFDGTFWSIVDAPAAFAAEATGANPPTGIGYPYDRGVIVLVGPDSATWTSHGGIAVRLARAGSDVRVFGCD